MLLLSKLALVEEWTVKYSGFSESLDIVLSDKSKILNYRAKGTWEDTLGNYGIQICIGLMTLDPDERLTTGNFYCEAIDQDDEKYIVKGSRETDMNAGIGNFKIIDAIGKWKKHIGAICTYAVKYKNDALFTIQRCKN